MHLRLGEGDPVAPADLCRAYLGSLLDWLEAKCPGADPHLRQTAAHEALLTYLKDLPSYDPRRSDLAAYLRMAARGDLYNLLRQEGRHHRDRLDWLAVEEDAAGGNLCGEDDEPAARLVRQEEAEAWQTVLRAVEERCTESEKRVLGLMLAGEHGTAAFAAVLGIADRPVPEQEREVKKVKDRLKKRLTREGKA